jgi:hypothetical protein
MQWDTYYKILGTVTSKDHICPLQNRSSFRLPLPVPQPLISSASKNSPCIT